MSAIQMSPAVGYLRVSTQEQGRSGLGLAAQRFEIEAFAAREGFSVKSWYQDVQTGAGADALQLRPGLAAALKQARDARYPLIVSRLDRLSRNVHFISGLMEHRVHFMVAAFGRVVDNLMLHIHASVAEHERNLIAERCRAAAAAQKRRGQKFGFALKSKAYRRRIYLLSAAARYKAVVERTEAYRMHVEWALGQPGRCGRPISFTAAARKLNERQVQSPMGGRWCKDSLRNMACRLGFPFRRDNLIPLGVIQARVGAVLKQHPDITVTQMMRSVRSEFPLGTARASMLLDKCRRATAGRNPTQKRTGWPFDCRTTARIRISTIWKRDPEVTARQVRKQIRDELRPRNNLSLRWVTEILRDCWRVSGKRSPEQLRIGRRQYGSWRVGSRR